MAREKKRKKTASRSPSSSRRLIAGKACITRSGNGYVLDETTGTEFFVPCRVLGTALHGDIVEIVPISERDQKRGRRQSSSSLARRNSRVKQQPVGQVIRIIERSRNVIVGIVKRTNNGLCLVPVNPVYARNFDIVNLNGAKVDDYVAARFVSWDDRRSNPRADIVEIIGTGKDPSIDTILIIKQYGIKDHFPDEILRDAEDACSFMDEPGERLDLRNSFVITIDPDGARDFDDALSLERKQDGNYLIGVHIADVSHFVKANSALDKEARERGNSVYLCDKVVPMLPQQLSNNICSLRPDEDRLTFSVLMTINEAGNVVSSQFAKSIIKSRHRLTYKQAMNLLECPDGTEVSLLLADLNEQAQRLRRNRIACHALDLNVPECKLVMGPDNTVTGIELVKSDPSHQLIEEYMVAANEAVATLLGKTGIQTISRLHEPPAADKIEELTLELRELGYYPKNLGQQANIASFLKSLLKDDPLAHHASVAVLRSMQRAVYSSKLRGHYGLAKKFYVHFTSPIRRYPDLIVHRQLHAAILSERKKMLTNSELEIIASRTTETERNAELAERNLVEMKKMRFLQEQLLQGNKKEYPGIVIKVMRNGMVIEIPDIQMQGFIHISEINRKAHSVPGKMPKLAKFKGKENALAVGKELYKPGKMVKVSILKVDLENRRVDFGLV